MVDDEPDIIPDTTSIGNLVTNFGTMISGIPKIFQKPLVKAFGRLVYGVVDVPASALEAVSSDIKSKQQNKEKMRSALAKRAISQISESPEIIERALDYFTNQAIGGQNNRQAVFNSAADSLAQEKSDGHASTEQTDGKVPDLDDDWLNEFSYRAERASTERMQQLFGRVLAGEIRNPGSFSLFTLDFLCKISQREASLITDLAPYVIGNSVPLTKTTRKEITFEMASMLGSIGVLTPTSIGATSARYNFNTIRDKIVTGRCGAVISRDPGKIMVILSDEEKTIGYDCHVLTTLGKEILSLHHSSLDQMMLREFSALMKAQGAELFLIPAPRLVPGVPVCPIVPE